MAESIHFFIAIEYDEIYQDLFVSLQFAINIENYLVIQTVTFLLYYTLTYQSMIRKVGVGGMG